MFGMTVIQQIDVPDDVPKSVAKLRTYLVRAKDKNPEGLIELLEPELIDWETMNLMEFGIKNPDSVQSHLGKLKKFLGK